MRKQIAKVAVGRKTTAAAIKSLRFGEESSPIIDKKVKAINAVRMRIMPTADCRSLKPSKRGIKTAKCPPMAEEIIRNAKLIRGRFGADRLLKRGKRAEKLSTTERK